MKIRELSLKNYRSFEDCTIQFEDYYTAICGKNNSGKSNILRAVLNTLERSRHYERFNYSSDFPVWKTQGKGEDIEICLKLHLDSQADTGLIKFIEIFLSDNKKVEAIQQMRYPEDKEELHRFFIAPICNKFMFIWTSPHVKKVFLAGLLYRYHELKNHGIVFALCTSQ